MTYAKNSLITFESCVYFLFASERQNEYNYWIEALKRQTKHLKLNFGNIPLHDSMSGHNTNSPNWENLMVLSSRLETLTSMKPWILIDLRVAYWIFIDLWVSTNIEIWNEYSSLAYENQLPFTVFHSRSSFPPINLNLNKF